MAIVRVSRHAWVRALAVIYIQAIQGVPVLLLLFIFYFGLGVLGYRLPTLVAVSVGLVLYASAFLADIWRGSLQSIPRPPCRSDDRRAGHPCARPGRSPRPPHPS